MGINTEELEQAELTKLTTEKIEDEDNFDVSAIEEYTKQYKQEGEISGSQMQASAHFKLSTEEATKLQ